MNVVPQRVDFTIKQGSAFSIPVLFSDASKSPIDFTNCSAAMQVRQMRSGALIADLSTDPSKGGLALNTPVGTITISMTAAQTAAYPVSPSTSAVDASAFAYDVVVMFPDGPYTYLYGVVSVIAAITTVPTTP